MWCVSLLTLETDDEDAGVVLVPNSDSPSGSQPPVDDNQSGEQPVEEPTASSSSGSPSSPSLPSTVYSDLSTGVIDQVADGNMS
jgi:hypothetical protein